MRMRQRMRAAGIAAMVFALATALSACTSSADQHSEGSESAVTPASEWKLVGRWQAPKPANQDAFVEFTEYGLWFASDGCNRGEGSWAIDDEGGFSTGGVGAMTQVGCDNVPIPETVWGAQSATTNEAGELLLTTAGGDELTLVRTDGERVSLVGRWVGPASATSLTTVDFAEDGTFTAMTGCGDVQGTWELGPSDTPPLENPTTDYVYVPSAGLLRIGGQTEQPGICVGDQVAPALANNTDYTFAFSDRGSFYITSLTALEDFETPSLSFHRVEQPAGFGH